MTHAHWKSFFDKMVREGVVKAASTTSVPTHCSLSTKVSARICVRRLTISAILRGQQMRKYSAVYFRRTTSQPNNSIAAKPEGSADSERLTDFMPGVNKPDADCHDDRTDD